MNEGERVEWLTRAIDSLIRGEQPADSTAGMDKDGLESLIQAAQARLESSLLAAKAGLQHEGDVWRDLLARLDGEGKPDAASGPDADDEELSGLTEVARARREMSEQLIQLAETHRSAVWHEVQTRIAGQAAGTGVSWLRRRTRRSRDDASSLSSPRVTMPPVELGPRLAIGPMADSTAYAARQRVWERVSASAIRADTLQIAAVLQPQRRQMPYRFALAAAGLAILVAGLGPLPATGLAEHPARRLVASVADQFGAREATPPQFTNLPEPEIIEVMRVTAAEASVIMGVPVAAPSVPAEFGLVSSGYYPNSVTATSGGSFVMTFSSGNSQITVIQEGASGEDLAAGNASLSAIVLEDGTPATLINGSWATTREGLSWSASGQSLVFDRDGTRAIISYEGPDAHVGTLIEVAASMSAR